MPIKKIYFMRTLSLIVALIKFIFDKEIIEMTILLSFALDIFLITPLYVCYNQIIKCA